jgi:drug/metabolite transporter (DMT)-like permease
VSPRILEHPRLPHAAGALGALMIAFSAIFVRLADVSPVTAAVYRCAYALPFLAAIAAWERRRLGLRPLASRVPAWGAGLFFAADLILWHHAIGYIGAGLSTVLGNAQVVLVGLVAWVVLRERPRPQVLVAVPVVLVGGVLISGVVGAGAYGADPLLGAIFALTTAFAYSGFILLLRHGNADLRRPAGPLFDATLAAGAAATLAGLVLGDLDLAPVWPAHGWLAALALNSQVVGWLLISVSLPRLPALVTSILLMLQPVGSVLLGMWLLAEAPSATQLGGVAVVIGGVLLASAPGRRDQSDRAASSPTASSVSPASASTSASPASPSGAS